MSQHNSESNSAEGSCETLLLGKMHRVAYEQDDLTCQSGSGSDLGEDILRTEPTEKRVRVPLRNSQSDVEMVIFGKPVQEGPSFLYCISSFLR